MSWLNVQHFVQSSSLQNRCLGFHVRQVQRMLTTNLFWKDSPPCSTFHPRDTAFVLLSQSTLGRELIAPDLILTLHHLPQVVSQAKTKPGGINISRSLFWHWPNLGWYWETATASFRTTYRVRKIVKYHSIKYCDVTEKSEIEIASTINPRWFMLWLVLMPLC